MDVNGTVIKGVVVLDVENAIPEGTRVRVAIDQNQPLGTTLGQRLLRFAGTAKHLPSDMADNHDHYVHGRQTVHISYESCPLI